MRNTTKLLILAIVFYFLAVVCYSTGNLVLAIIGIILKLIGVLLFLLWFALIGKAVPSPEAPQQRCCPHCRSRHYIAYPRGTRFGFAFPARFVKVAITDYRCLNCGETWDSVEVIKHDAE